MERKLTEDLLYLFVEKNSDGFRNLRLKGNELKSRIGRRLSASDMTIIGSFLSQNSNIVELNVCYNDFGDEGVANLIESYLQKPNGLEHLNMMACSLTAMSVSLLYKTCSTLVLRTLRISCNKLGIESGGFLAKLVDSLTTLIYLDVGDSDQTIFSINGLLSRMTYSSIEVLNISRVLPDNMYAQTESAELANEVALILEYNTTLVEIHLQKCQMDGHDIELLAEGLKRNETLLLLDVGFNKIGDHGAEIISKWLVTRPNLLGLNVAGNRIKDNGAISLSLRMPFSKVRFLDITYNRITDKGLMHILYSIKKPYQLRIFYFWGNLFGPETNRVLDRMLKSNVLYQEYIDIKLYTVDKVIYAAYYPTNRYKHKYYGVMDYGYAPELKIIRNFIVPEDAKPRALLNFVHMDRYPIITKGELKKPDGLSTITLKSVDVGEEYDEEDEAEEIDAGEMEETEEYGMDASTAITDETDTDDI